MTKKILVILGHPNENTFNGALFNAYISGAKKSEAQIRTLKLGNLKFNPNLKYGYKKRTPLEKDLINAQKDILWSEHIVFVYPTWWGNIPAIMKGFIDRTLLPGYAFKYHENDPFWDKLLKGRSARLIFTMDAPKFFYWYIGSPGYKMMKNSILKFCGIKPVKKTIIDKVKSLNEKKRKKYLNKIYKLGLEMK